jgi:hypothetical protein
MGLKEKVWMTLAAVIALLTTAVGFRGSKSFRMAPWETGSDG